MGGFMVTFYTITRDERGEYVSGDKAILEHVGIVEVAKLITTSVENGMVEVHGHRIESVAPTADGVGTITQGVRIVEDY